MLTEIYLEFIKKNWKLYCLLLLSLLSLPLQKLAMPHFYGSILGTMRQGNMSKSIYIFGIILLGTPDFDSGCARLFGNNYRLLNDPTHISLFSNDSMHRFLRDHGFTIDYVEYPFFNTRHFTEDNLKALFNTSKVSPPFYGNFMTFYCHL